MDWRAEAPLSTTCRTSYTASVAEIGALESNAGRSSVLEAA